MADLVEDIKARLDIVEVVFQYVQLKKVGRNFKGLCPFHSEKTPSFVVSPEKQICHCFGCNRGGDIFTFIEEVEGVEFTEAIQILADKAGLKVENVSKFRKKEGKSEKDEYYNAHDLACEFFQRELFKTNDGKKVLDYLKKRGIKEDTIKEFKLGFSPDKYDALYPYLLKKGISKKVLIKSGFATSKNIASDEIYDKFRGRLMFPIFDYMGRVCGFGGRALKKDQMPKYLNSPENPVYSKSKILYGLYHSKASVKEKDQIILVEGYFDVITPYQHGIKNLVAVSGTALTPDQAVLIKRLTSNVVTCFDLDEAGFEATKRAYLILKNADLLMKTVSGFDVKDPADLVKEKGGGAFSDLLDKAEDFVIFYMNKLLLRNDVSMYEGRRTLIREFLPIFKGMATSAKDYYVRELSAKLSMKEEFLYDEIEAFKLPPDHPVNQAVSDRKDSGGVDFSVDEILISLILDNPGLFEKLSKLIKIDDFSEDMKNVYKALYDQYNSARIDFTEWIFDKGFLAKEREKMNILLLYGQDRYGRFSQDSLELEVEKLVDKMKKVRKSRRLADLHKNIQETEKNGDKEGLMKLLKEQQELLMLS